MGPHQQSCNIFSTMSYLSLSCGCDFSKRKIVCLLCLFAVISELFFIAEFIKKSSNHSCVLYGATRSFSHPCLVVRMLSACETVLIQIVLFLSCQIPKSFYLSFINRLHNQWLLYGRCWDAFLPVC